jgi:hypothetical protein
MRFACRVSQPAADLWAVSYEGADLGPVSVTAATRQQALEKMQRELRYRLEMCPCTGEIYKDIEIELREQ